MEPETVVEKRKEINGERMLQCAMKHLQSVKAEEGGSGPATFWRTLGPKMVSNEVIIVCDNDDQEDESVPPSCNTDAVAGPSAAQISGKRVGKETSEHE